MEQRWRIVLGFIYIILGVYLLNSFFTFVNIPEVIKNIDRWIFLIAGILIIFAGFKNFGRSYGY